MHVGLSLLTLLPGKVGGSEAYVRGLLEAFAADGEPQRTTVLVTKEVGASYEGLVLPPVSLHEVQRFRYRDHPRARALAIAGGVVAGDRLLDRRGLAGIDVVHHPLTVRIPRVRPSVVTYHDAQHLHYPEFFSRAERLYRAVAYDHGARSAEMVVTPSGFTRDAVIERLNLAPERVAVAHHGIDHTRFHTDSTADGDLVAELDVPERYIVYPANLWPHKNHHRLLEALARSADRELGLVLTGGIGKAMQGLQSVASDLGVAHRVRHLGYVADAQIPALYRRAEATVFPSLYEGFGSPPLEAMACGCPTAVARSGALPETCGDGALYFDPCSPEAIGEAIDKVVGDSTTRRRLRKAGVDRAAGFTWTASARHHAEAYRAAIAHHVS